MDPWVENTWTWTHGYRRRGHELMGAEDVDVDSWVQNMWMWAHGCRRRGRGLMGAEHVDVGPWVQNTWTCRDDCRIPSYSLTKELRKKCHLYILAHKAISNRAPADFSE